MLWFLLFHVDIRCGSERHTCQCRILRRFQIEIRSFTNRKGRLEGIQNPANGDFQSCLQWLLGILLCDFQIFILQTRRAKVPKSPRMANSSRVSTVALGYSTRRLSKREKPLRSQVQAVHRGNKILSQLLQRRPSHARLEGPDKVSSMIVYCLKIIV